MKMLASIAGGLAGALVLTALHEATRRLVADAPRMDLLGEEALTLSLKAAKVEPPQGEKLYAATMASDILSNALYYSSIGAGGRKQLMLRGLMYGLSAGFGALEVPKHVDSLSEEHSNRTRKTQILTVALYTLGGVAAAVTMQALTPRETFLQKVKYKR
jgi:hypothetical protein